MSSTRDLAQTLKPIVYSERMRRVNGLVEKAALRAYWRSKYWRWHTANRSKLLTYGGPGIDEAKRYKLYEKLIADENLQDVPLDYWEFGVAAGTSMRWWCDHLRSPETRLVGFDVFTGLPEAWESLTAGTFSTDGHPPDIGDRRCSFRKGLVQQTLPVFLREVSLNRHKIIHLDLDLYGGTLFTLLHVAPVLRPGDILIFDEFASYMNEFRAWSDFLGACPMEFEPRYGTNDFFQVAFKTLRELGQ